MTRPYNKQQQQQQQQQQKRASWTVDFAVPADHRVKLKESEKKDKYRNLRIVHTSMDAPVISTNVHRCVNNSHDIKVLMKVIKTETFKRWLYITINPPIWIILLFCILYIYIYIYIYIYQLSKKRVLCPKVNIVARLEFELAYFEAAVQLSYYITGILPT